MSDEVNVTPVMRRGGVNGWYLCAGYAHCKRKVRKSGGKCQSCAVLESYASGRRKPRGPATKYQRPAEVQPADTVGRGAWPAGDTLAAQLGWLADRLLALEIQVEILERTRRPLAPLVPVGHCARSFDMPAYQWRTQCGRLVDRERETPTHCVCGRVVCELTG